MGNEERKSKVRAEIFTAAAKYYQYNIRDSAEAWKYIDGRKHSRDIIRHSMIGWTGTEKKGLFKYLAAAPFGEDEIIASGLVKKGEHGYYDYFPLKAIVFPLLKGGQVNHFRFKDITGAKKYQLPSEFKLNGQLFYNEDDFRRGKIILVEGENDVLTVKRILEAEKIPDAGVIGIIGQLSQAQTDFLLANSAKKELFCMFDSDGVATSAEDRSKGRGYTHKLIDVAAGKLDISVVEYGREGDDPDDYLNGESHDSLKSLLFNASDGVEWMISHLPDINSRLKIAKILEPVIKIIARFSIEQIDDYLEIIREKYPKCPSKKQLKIKLREAGAKISTEINAFEVYDSTSQLFVSDNCVWIPTKDDKRMISNFTFELQNIYSYEDAFTQSRYLRYECILRNYKGARSNPIVFDPEERVNINKFMSRCAGEGEFHFWGNTQNLLHLWSFVEENSDDVKITNLIQKYGYLKKHDLWLFYNCAIKAGKIYKSDKNGTIFIDKKGFRSEGVLVYSGDNPVMDTSDIDDKEVSEIIENFWALCDGEADSDTDMWNTFTGIIMLGFVAAMIYRNEIMKKYGFFPLLCNYGPSQTGKSVTTKILLNFFGFQNPPETWESSTMAGVTQALAQLSNLPYYLDEFRIGSNRQHRGLLGLVRNAYNGAAPGKGGLGKRQIYEIESVIWLAGEDTPDDRATISRLIVNRFTELNQSRDIAYNWFQDKAERLSAVTVKLIRDKTALEALPLFDKIKEVGSKLLELGVTDERTRTNIAIPIAAFLYVFNKYRPGDAFRDKFIDYGVLVAKEDVQRKANEDILKKVFGHMEELMDTIPFCNLVSIDLSRMELFFFPREFISAYKKWLRDRGDSIDEFKESTLIDYWVKSKFLIKDKNRNSFVRIIGDLRKRAYCFDYTKMPDYLREIFRDRFYPDENDGDFFLK